MSKQRAFSGFGGPGKGGPDPHDVARIGTQLAIGMGLRSGLEQKAHAQIVEGLAGPAALADAVAEKIGSAVEEGVGDAQLLARGVVDKAQGAFMRAITTPTETAVRLGWVPQGAPGSGAGGRPGRGRSRSPRPAPGAPPGQEQPPQPAGSGGEAPGTVPGASTVNMAPTFPPPGGPVSLPGGAGGSSGGLTVPRPSSSQPGATAGQQLLGGGLLQPAPLYPAAPPLPANPWTVCLWACLVDCSRGEVLVVCLEDPRVTAMVAAGAFVPIRYSHDPHREHFDGIGAPELQDGWINPNLRRQAEWVALACAARNGRGAGWPPGGDFAHNPTEDGGPNGVPVGDWPFDPAGNYTGE